MPQIEYINQSLPLPLTQLIEESSMPSLSEGLRCDVTSSKIPSLLDELSMAGTLKEAGLWLLANDLHRSHSISQDHTSAEGSFWHGIMHRREGDYGNAKYWFRRVGRHRVHDEITRELPKILDEKDAELADFLVSSDDFASALVDACNQLASGSRRWKSGLERICWYEWQGLFDYCVDNDL